MPRLVICVLRKSPERGYKITGRGTTPASCVRENQARKGRQRRSCRTFGTPPEARNIAGVSEAKPLPVVCRPVGTFFLCLLLAGQFFCFCSLRSIFLGYLWCLWAFFAPMESMKPPKGLKDHRQGRNPCFMCEGEPSPGRAAETILSYLRHSIGGAEHSRGFALLHHLPVVCCPFGTFLLFSVV